MQDIFFNEDGLICSGHYAETMESRVLPFLASRQRDEIVSGDGGKPLFCSVFTAEKPVGTVLVLHGFTENAFKYSEIIYSLLQNGFSVVAYDQRGHGRSWRKESLGDLSLTHVDRFDEYVKDLEAVCGAVLSSMPKPWAAFAHSMGGAVLGLFLEGHPGVFSRAALSAPMIAPSLKGVPRFAAKAICRAPIKAGKGEERMFFSKPYHGPEDFATSCAAGRERFDWYDGVKAARKEFQNNGPSYAWTMESINVTRLLLAPGAVEKIACPVRLYTADRDFSVLPEPQKKFIERVRRGTRVFVPGSRHEIYRSGDDVLFPWWHDVLRFLKGEME